jgi:hypothetical protein
MNRAKGERCLLGSYVGIASLASILLLAIGERAQARDVQLGQSRARPPLVVPHQLRASEGRVVEVRRGSREIAVRTARGEIERIVIPMEAAIRAPHGATALGGIHTGMSVHAEGEADRHGRLVARKLSAR